MSIGLIYRLKQLEILDDEDFLIMDSMMLAQRNTPRHFFIISEKYPQPHIHFVIEGWAIKYKTLENGERQIINFVLPGDIVAIYSPLFQNSEHTVESITEMRLGYFSASLFFETIRKSPRLAAALMWMAGQDERVLEEQIVRVGRRRSIKRMAHLLAELHRRLRLAGLSREEAQFLPLNQSLLSDALGLSHIHAHRIFRELDKMGLIVRTHNSIQLLNLKLLADFADFDASYLEPIANSSTAKTLKSS
ncbi:Crp/Fnr family transcriptional regulator [Nitrosomonas sp. PY1]|uniref:Crp/Fnr family transcriptional regulator n=1 Tax=Nitrosomonas sp. PY1 TaxID=1803906 RepID=UPI001FC8E589|nr:Crp/Fnr family transcriptional regulator [Nitrosomonas sp. PY1]GKS70149.1 Crp/Fnr family transcriptional regulator [Nitrosomonas sp. PY1]